MKNKFVVLITAIVLTLGSYPTKSRAGDNIDEMKAIYDKGVELYGQERYGEAAEAFRELVKERPTHQYYYNIGECEYMRQRFDLAKESFETFLKEGGHKTNQKRRAYAEDVLEKITPKIAYVSIDEGANFEVWIDDERRGITPTKPIVVMPGDRIVVLKRDGEEALRTKVTVERGDTAEVKIQKTETSTAPPPPQEPVPETETATTSLQGEPRPPKEVSPLKVSGISMIGVGGAVLIAGAITGGLSHKKSIQLDSNCPDRDNCDISNQGLKDSGQSLELATNGLIAAGAMITTVGVVLTIIGHRKGKKENLSASPVVNGTNAGLIVHGRF